MRPVFWKRLLSYFTDIQVESVSSDWNPHLQVLLSRGRYQLCTSGAIYSYEDLYANFYLTFAVLHSGYNAVFPKGPGREAGRMYLRQGRLFEEPFTSVLAGRKSVLLLGLGLGSVPWMLERHFGLNFHYTAVEVDEAVVYLAQKYALGELKSPMEIVCADALAFVEQDHHGYDLVVMDVFRDAVIPAAFQTSSFLDCLRSRLSPNGVLLFNFLARTTEDRRQADRFFREKFLRVFPLGNYLDTGGNWVLMNGLD